MANPDDGKIVIDMKPWRCEHGHVLGLVQRVGEKSARLMIYRHAVDMEKADLRQVDVQAVVEFGLVDVICDLCGASRTWAPNQEAYERMMKMYLPEVKNGMKAENAMKRVKES